MGQRRRVVFIRPLPAAVVTRSPRGREILAGLAGTSPADAPPRACGYSEPYGAVDFPAVYPVRWRLQFCIVLE